MPRNLLLHLAQQLLDLRVLWIEALKVEQNRPDTCPLLLIHQVLHIAQDLTHMLALEIVVDRLDIHGHFLGRLVSIDRILGQGAVEQIIKGGRITGVRA